MKPIVRTVLFCITLGFALGVCILSLIYVLTDYEDGKAAQVRINNIMADNMMKVSEEWDKKFGPDLDSRQTFNINMLIQVVNKQQQTIEALQKPVEDPNR